MCVRWDSLQGHNKGKVFYLLVQLINLYSICGIQVVVFMGQIILWGALGQKQTTGPYWSPFLQYVPGHFHVSAQDRQHINYSLPEAQFAWSAAGLHVAEVYPALLVLLSSEWQFWLACTSEAPIVWNVSIINAARQGLRVGSPWEWELHNSHVTHISKPDHYWPCVLFTNQTENTANIRRCLSSLIMLM